jgi:aromatic-L-amino-acid/L-tryptophan decarboxylase
LRHVGAAGYRKMIAEDIALSKAMADAISRRADLQLVTQDLSIATFRAVPPDLRSKVGDPLVEKHLDALNRELLDRLQHGGETFVSNAIVDGRYVLRACIVNFHSSRADVEAVPEIVARIGRSIDAELRAGNLEGRS